MNENNNSIAVALIIAITMIMLSGVGACYHTKHDAMKFGYCEAQSYGTTLTRWVKCSDPR